MAVSPVNWHDDTQLHCVPGRCGRHLLESDRIQVDLKHHIERDTRTRYADQIDNYLELFISSG